MAPDDIRTATAVHDVHGLTHVHPRQLAGATLYPGGFVHTGGLTRCLIRNGTTGVHQDFGNSFQETFNLGIGVGFHCVNVQLAGWDLNFAKKDHHLDRIKVQIRGADYDSNTGNVSFTVSGIYRDKNGDDDFTWEVWYTILALA